MREAVSVSQLNRYIKEMFSDSSILNNVIVKGEVSNLKESKGNFYFSLKDQQSAIQCIVFTNYSGNGVDLSGINDGIEVVVYGRVSVYEKAGTYAIYVNKIENYGIGEYYIKLEKLKMKLSELGMFDSMYKKEIPKYSMNIGVVTAKNGAAIRDIYKTIKDKNPYANVILYPSLVQGENAYKTIVDGIMELDKMGLDVIIVGRGGGSIEDLYCFNDERVAYAIFNSKTPIISAVGHEINDSISDLVADKRVATPTAAGELATFNYDSFVEDIENYKLTFDTVIESKIDKMREKLDSIRTHISLLAPSAKVERYKEGLNYISDKLQNSIYNKMLQLRSKIHTYSEMLKSRSFSKRLGSGMAFITFQNGKKIKSIRDIKIGDKVLLRLKDGVLESRITKIMN